MIDGEVLVRIGRWPVAPSTSPSLQESTSTSTLRHCWSCFALLASGINSFWLVYDWYGWWGALAHLCSTWGRFWSALHWRMAHPPRPNQLENMLKVSADNVAVVSTVFVFQSKAVYFCNWQHERRKHSNNNHWKMPHQWINWLCVMERGDDTRTENQHKTA